MIIVALLFVAAGAWWVYWSAQAKRMDRMTAALPSPPALPVLGHALSFIGDAEKMLENLEELAKIAHQHKGAVKVWLGPKLYIAIANPEDSQVILDNCLDKDAVYRFLRPWLGHGLFVAPLGLWKSHRKVLLPVFHNKIVGEFAGVIAEQADVLVARLGDMAERGNFDVLKYITACTLDIVFETAMGERMDVQHSPDTPYLKARNVVMTILNMRFFKVWLQPDCLFNLTPYAKQQKDNIDLTHKFTDEVVKKRRSEYNTKRFNTDYIRTGVSLQGKGLPLFGPGFKVASDHSSNDKTIIISQLSLCRKESGKLRSVLDLLFGREIEFTNEQLREHIDSITIAGNDTTALVIAYTLVLLGVHQEAQERAYQEQLEVLGDSKSGATKEDVQKMPYLERVLKESMRLYTVVPIIGRTVDKDTYLPKCGVTVPAGAGAVVAAFTLHRSVAVWGPTANEFDPDRFLPENSTQRHPAAFLPFSYGARNCIGRNFGMLIMKSIVSSVLRSYRIEADEIGPLKIEMLLFPIKGHQIKVTRR